MLFIKFYGIKQGMDRIQEIYYRLSELPIWQLVAFYTILILVHIYLPEPLWILRNLISPVVTFLLFFVSWVAVRNLIRDWD